MKKLFSYFVDFHKTYFQPRLYIVVLLFVTLLIAFNYTFNFEDSYIDRIPNPFRLLGFLSYHGLAYFGVLFIIRLLSGEKLKLTGLFWLKSLIGFFILSLDRSYYTFLYDAIPQIVPGPTITFFRKLSINSVGLLLMFLPLLMVRLVFDRKANNGIYGLTLTNVDWKPYWWMLLAMVPLIFAASFLPDFMAYYPTYKRAGGQAFAEYYGIPIYWSMFLYETFYIGDFLFTELFFRGFLVIGLGSLIGKHAILPMAATYAVLHFGKPIGETISSVFGGYILGIIALYSRNIWGGVFVHGGIAGLMELFAFYRME